MPCFLNVHNVVFSWFQFTSTSLEEERAWYMDPPFKHSHLRELTFSSVSGYNCEYELLTYLLFVCRCPLQRVVLDPRKWVWYTSEINTGMCSNHLNHGLDIINGGLISTSLHIFQMKLYYYYLPSITLVGFLLGVISF